jgi:chemotaxis protein CheD
MPGPRDGNPGGQTVVVPIAGLAVSADPATTLATYALGSCVAVALHDARGRRAGLLHFMLPTAVPGQRAPRAAMFCDTGLPLLVRQLEALGAARASLTCRLVGGGALNDASGVFRVGARNVEMAHATLGRLGLKLAAEDVGGPWSRSVQLQVGSGILTVRSRGKEYTL